MWDLFKNRRTLFAAAVALIVAFLVYSYSLKSQEQTNPFERGILTLSAPLMGVVAGFDRYLLSLWADYLALVSTQKENQSLRESVRHALHKKPFHIDAWVVLPDHLHSTA